MFERKGIRPNLVFADNENIARPDFHRRFKRLFELEAFVTEFYDQIVAAQLTTQAGGGKVHSCSQWSDVDIWLADHRFGGLAQREHETVFADGEADSGS